MHVRKQKILILSLIFAHVAILNFAEIHIPSDSMQGEVDHWLLLPLLLRYLHTIKAYPFVLECTLLKMVSAWKATGNSMLYSLVQMFLNFGLGFGEWQTIHCPKHLEN